MLAGETTDLVQVVTGPRLVETGLPLADPRVPIEPGNTGELAGRFKPSNQGGTSVLAISTLKVSSAYRLFMGKWCIMCLLVGENGSKWGKPFIDKPNN